MPVNQEDQPKPRTAIPKHFHGVVDLVLKDLKIVSRRITNFTVPFQEELRVLERLFYKNKNQHKSAIFWHKVSEVRKYGKRVAALNILAGFQKFRYSFHVNSEKADPKVLRSPWTQLPTPSSLKFILDWLESVSYLLHQAHIRFCHAYNIFTIHARCGTFLPLLVSLVAVISRLDFLIRDLQQTLSLYWKALYRMFQEVMLSSKMSLNPFLPAESLEDLPVTTFVNEPPPIPTGPPEDHKEDVDDRPTSLICQGHSAESVADNAISTIFPVSCSNPSALGAQVEGPESTSNQVAMVKTSAHRKKPKKDRNKSSTKRDDIDDIFDLC